MISPLRTALLACFCLFCIALPARAQSPTPLQQMHMLKELKPDIKKLGIIISESNPKKAAILDQVQKAAARTGMSIVLAAPKDMNDVASQVRELTRTHHVQALWVPEGDKLIDADVSRSFIVKMAASERLVLLVPTEEWVKKGACLSFQAQGDGIKIVVNKAIAGSVSLTIPAKYADRTQFN